MTICPLCGMANAVKIGHQRVTNLSTNEVADRAYYHCRECGRVFVVKGEKEGDR